MKGFLRWAAALGAAGMMAAGPIAMHPAEALTEAQVLERLSGIPVFTIADEKGNPLLATVPKEAMKDPKAPTQLLLYFLNPDDAKAMMDRIKASNPEVGKNARLVVQSLNVAYDVIKKNEKNKDVAFQIVPSRTSLESARTILTAGGKAPERLPAIPVFFATGGKDKQGLLTLEQDGKQFVPFFFEQKDLQGLLDRAKQERQAAVVDTSIQVTSLFQVLDSMVTKGNNSNPDAERFTFVPGRTAFEYVVKNQPPQASRPSAPQPAPAAPKPAPSAPKK